METEHKNKKKYRISPRLKSLMGKVTIDPKDLEDDDRAQYILNKWRYMNTIKQLIEKYCPDGVEYKKLGEVCKTIPAPVKVKTSQYFKKATQTMNLSLYQKENTFYTEIIHVQLNM